jgi:hypothetical protein
LSIVLVIVVLFSDCLFTACTPIPEMDTIVRLP